MKIIGERLRELRGTVQLSQAKMGKTFGVGQSSIYKYENDESTVPAEILMKYAEYFDVSFPRRSRSSSMTSPNIRTGQPARISKPTCRSI